MSDWFDQMCEYVCSIDTYSQVKRKFSEESHALRMVESFAYPDGYRCSHCGGEVYLVTDARRGEQLKCKASGLITSIKTNTPLTSSKLPIQKYIYAVYLYKRLDFSTIDVSKLLGITQKTAFKIKKKLSERTPVEKYDCSQRSAAIDLSRMAGMTPKTWIDRYPTLVECKKLSKELHQSSEANEDNQ